MEALITAGGIPLPGEPLFEYTRGGPKAMLSVAGKPMLQHVINALVGSKSVTHITIIGLTELSGLSCPLPLTLLPNQPDMLSNIITGMREISARNPGAEQMLLVASDIPALTGQMVDWMVDIVEKSDADLFYNVVTRQVMEARYPGSRRTYTRLKDLEICGGDLSALRLDMLDNLSDLWGQLIASRKNPVKQAAIMGFGLLFQLLTRQATLEDAARMISDRLGIKGKVILCPFAELGMDADKPFQLEILQKDLASRG
jgi:molybdopterin-guanine dinucleotide biosynthesis protein A